MPPLALDPKQYEELERHRTAWGESALQKAYAQARATKFVFTRRMGFSVVFQNL